MEKQLWRNADSKAGGEGKEEEEEEEEEEDTSGDSEDETDEEEEKERYVRKEIAGRWVGGRVASRGEVVSEDGNDEDGEVADAEPLGRASKVSPPGGDRRVKGQKGKRTSAEESDSGSGSGSEGSSDEETGRSIAVILASDRVAPGEGSAKKAGFRREKPSRAGVGQTEDAVAKNSKSEIQNTAREEVKEQEEIPTKRKKEGGARKRELKSPSTSKGKKAQSQSEKETLKKPDREGINEVQMPQSNKERTETARKKSRKQKHFVQDDSQKPDSEATEEPKIKDRGPQKKEKVTEKKTNKKHRGPEDDKPPLERIELESESKVKNQKQQKSQLPADNALKFQQSQQEKPAVWSPGDEIALAYSVKHHLKLVGKNLPKRVNDLWDKVSEDFRNNRTRDQLYDKVRKMRCRYLLVARKTKAAGSIPFNYRNEHEENLFRIWDQIWGREEGESDEDNGEEEAGEEEHEHSKSMAKTEALNPRKEVRGMELLSAKEKQGERRDKDANDTLQERASPMELDQTHLPTSTLASLANVSMSNGPLESSAGLMRPHQNTSVLNSTGDRVLPQPDAENPLMTELFNFMRSSNQVMLDEVKSQCDRVLGEVQAKTKTIVENRIKSAANGFQFYNGMNYFMPCPFPMPSLAGGDAMDIKFPDCNKGAQDKLMRQWHEQHLQELKIFSQRLHLMQEQCRIQQEELEFGMR